MPQKRPQTRESANYFNAFQRTMGINQLNTHLSSVPEWWKLRDVYGRNALMRAIDTRDADPELLHRPHMRALARGVDARGHNLFFHLVHAVKLGAPETPEGLEKASAWIKPLERLGVRPMKTPHSKWGLVVQHVMEYPTRNWSGFLPGLLAIAELGCASKDLMSTAQDWTDDDASLWWGCSEGTAETVAHWLMEVRPVMLEPIRRVARLASHTLRVEQRASLASPLRGALLFNDIALGLSRGNRDARATIQHELDAGVCFSVSDDRRGQYRARLKESDRAFFDESMAVVDARLLQAALPAVAARAPRLRL